VESGELREFVVVDLCLLRAHRWVAIDRMLVRIVIVKTTKIASETIPIHPIYAGFAEVITLAMISLACIAVVESLLSKLDNVIAIVAMVLIIRVLPPIVIVARHFERFWFGEKLVCSKRCNVVCVGCLMC